MYSRKHISIIFKTSQLTLFTSQYDLDNPGLYTNKSRHMIKVIIQIILNTRGAIKHLIMKFWSRLETLAEQPTLV